MKQLAVAVVVLMAVVAGVSWATSRTSSAQEQDPPPETTVPEQEAPEDFKAAIDEFLSCLRDEGIEVPDVAEGNGRFGFGFHFDLSEEDFDALANAEEACGDVFPLPHLEFGDDFPFGEGFEFGDKLPFGDELPFGDDFPFKGGLKGGILDFGFGIGGPLDIDALAECLSELGTFDNVDDVKAQLEKCLPEPEGFEFGDIESWLEENGIDGEGFPFGSGSFSRGPGHFDFDFGFDFDFDPDDSDVEESALEDASV